MDASHRDAIGEAGMLPNKIVGLVDKVIVGKKNNEDTREWLGLLKIGIEFI